MKIYSVVWKNVDGELSNALNEVQKRLVLKMLVNLLEIRLRFNTYYDRKSCKYVGVI